MFGVNPKEIDLVLARMKEAGYFAAIFMDEVDSIYMGKWGEHYRSDGFIVLQQIAYILVNTNA